jgi:hypothetical protein
MKKNKEIPGSSVTRIADKHKRKYITPEDIHAALKVSSVDRVRSDVLTVLGGITDYGAEDSRLCAFIAWDTAENKNR